MPERCKSFAIEFTGWCVNKLNSLTLRLITESGNAFLGPPLKQVIKISSPSDRQNSLVINQSTDNFIMLIISTINKKFTY